MGPSLPPSPLPSAACERLRLRQQARPPQAFLGLGASSTPVRVTMALARISIRDSSLEQYFEHVAHWILGPWPPLPMGAHCLSPFHPTGPPCAEGGGQLPAGRGIFHS